MLLILLAWSRVLTKVKVLVMRSFHISLDVMPSSICSGNCDTNHSSENWSLLPPGHKLLMMSHCKTTKGYSKTTISLTLREKSIQSEIFKSLMMNLDSKILRLSRNQCKKWKNVSSENFGESTFGGFFEFFEKFLDNNSYFSVC